MRGVRLCTNRSPVFVEHNGIFPPQFACDETQSVNYLRGVLSYGLIFIFGSYWADQTYESYETRLPLWDSGGKIAMEHARTQCGFPLDPLPKFFFSGDHVSVRVEAQEFDVRVSLSFFSVCFSRVYTCVVYVSNVTQLFASVVLAV